MDTCRNGQKKVLLFRVYQAIVDSMHELFIFPNFNQKNAQAKQNGSEFIFNVKFSSFFACVCECFLAVYVCFCGWITRVVPQKAKINSKAKFSKK